MSSPAAVVCREIFDENSQPSAEGLLHFIKIYSFPKIQNHIVAVPVYITVFI